MIDWVVFGLAQAAMPIPQGAYSKSKGDVELCLHKEASIEEFDRWIRSEPTLQPGKSDERFEVFDSTGEIIRQYVLTRPSEPAHPAITCRRMFIAEDQTTRFERKMSCFADKKACDALFMEFHSLDEQMKAMLRSKGG